MGNKSPRILCLIGVAIATLIGHLASAGQFKLIKKSIQPSAGAIVENLVKLPAEPTLTSVSKLVNPEQPGTSSLNTLPAATQQQIESVDSALFTKQQTGINSSFSEHSELLNFRTILQQAGFLRPAWQISAFAANHVDVMPTSRPFVVMIDPGHGGTDPGAIGHNGLLEKDLTLDIAKRVRLFLTEVAQIDVQLTRNHDYGLSRKARVNAIRRADADLVISLHFNHLPQTDINLVESYYAAPQHIERSLAIQHGHGKSQHVKNAPDYGHLFNFAQNSELAAQTLQQHVYSEVNYEHGTVLNAGIKEKSFFVLTQSLTPSVLMEISCLSHEAEAERLTKDDYRNRLAAALVDGIRSYFDKLDTAPLANSASIVNEADPGV